MKKIDGCALWVHILGVRRGGNKLSYIFVLYKYYWITPRQKKAMNFQN